MEKREKTSIVDTINTLKSLEKAKHDEGNKQQSMALKQAIWALKWMERFSVVPTKQKFGPIFIGEGEKADKASFFGRHRIFRKGRSLYIVKLKKDVERGKTGVTTDDIKEVIVHLHFVRKEALAAFIKGAQAAYDNWDGNR